MKCVRCGSEMKEGDRCCLKCGALNYSHPQNSDFIKEYAPKGEVIKANANLLKSKFTIWHLLILLIVIGIIIFFAIKFMG